jgi:acyl carrier protein
MENKIKEIISAVLNIQISDIGDSTKTDAISNWDSLNHIKILSLLEDELELEFEDEHIMKMNSYNEICKVVKDLI